MPEKKPETATQDLKSTVSKIKTNQQQKLNSIFNKSIHLNEEGLSLMNQIRKHLNTLEQIEIGTRNTQIKNAQKDLNRIKLLSLLIVVVIGSFLIVLIVIFRKYTQKKNQYEKILVEARMNAEELAKSKEIFLANMSHEIKTPLNAIYGFTEQVLQTKLDPQQKQQILIVKKSAAYLSELINNILTKARLQSGKEKVTERIFNLKEEIQEIFAAFELQAEKKSIDLVLNYGENLPQEISADAIKLKQVLFNLIGNAIKFTSKGSVEIEITKNLSK
ncbi:MAG: hypothetical protein HYZ42_04950 [Bacteroidetes bacterium]|nr:hypothetical protein [Bacteroidota bacterium]